MAKCTAAIFFIMVNGCNFSRKDKTKLNLDFVLTSTVSVLLDMLLIQPRYGGSNCSRNQFSNTIRLLI